MKIIGIETSHDDTSISILENGDVKSLITYSQFDIHKKYGGVIPELASREHVSNIALVLEEIKKVDNLKNIDYIAFTKEPGLIGPLKMGYLLAHGLAFALGVPLMPINHLVGHIYSGAIDQKIIYPALALIASGGHTQLILLKSVDDFSIIGQTQDDAVGEAFDKVARTLGMGFPGGPAIDKIYEKTELSFKTPMQDNSLNFSYSGLKSKVINYAHNLKQKQEIVNKKKIASAFQEAAIDQLISKTKLALERNKVACLILGGGVSANTLLRKRFKKLHNNAIIPDLKYATDNGAMIAKAAELKIISNT